MDTAAVKQAIAQTKLTIELVPKTAWFSNVRDHVSPSEWLKLSRCIIEEAGYHCRICGSQGKKHRVECHETWYYDDTVKLQKPTGLIALCPACHRVKHIGRTSMVGSVHYSIYHLARLTAGKKVWQISMLPSLFASGKSAANMNGRSI